MIIHREIAREVEPSYGKIGARVSVVKYDDGTYDIAVLVKRYSFSDWEVDYDIFPDTFKAETSMEVYGIIQNVIAPAYWEQYEIDLTF